MPVKYIGMMIFIFVILNLALIPLGNSSMNEHTRKNLNTVTSFGIVQEEQTFGILKYVKAPYRYFDALFDMMTESKNNPIFGSNTEIVRWLILAPIMGMVVFGLIIIFFGAFRRDI